MLMDQDKNLMDHVINWKSEIGAIAGPFSPNDTKDSWLARAARKSSISLRHIKSLYYGHVKDPKHSVASSVLSAAELARKMEARKDASRLAVCFETLAGETHAENKNFNRADVDSLLNAARILREMAGT